MPVGEETRLDARKRVTEALARFGVAGEVEIGAESATLRGYGPTVEVSCRPLLSGWGEASLEDRRDRANEIARQLARARRSVTTGPPPPRGPSWSRWIALAAALVLAVGALFAAAPLYRRFTAAPETDERVIPAVAEIEAYERERQRRAQRVCESTESRVMRGAAVGPADVEGWVVELALLTSTPEPRIANHPHLSEFVGPVADAGSSRIVWPGSPALVETTGSRARVSLLDGSSPQAGSAEWNDLRLVLEGRYVVSYFREQERIEHVRLARALAGAVESEYGGLFARCAHSQEHHLGSWFYGPSAGGATAALIYYMGTYARALHVRSSILRPKGGEVDRAHAFHRIATATAPLDKDRVRTLLASHGGMIAGKEGGPFSIRFPFRDANRASRASRAIARDLGIGVHR